MYKLWEFYRDKPFMLKITVGFVLGVLVGFIFGPSAQVLSPFGDLLLRLLNMIIVPLILFTLIAAVNNTNSKKLGKIGGKIFVYYILTTAVAIVIGLLLAMLVNPGLGLALPQENVEVPEAPTFIQVLLEIVPTNIFEAMVNADILGIIFVAIIIGLTLSSLRHASEAKLNDLGNTVLKITDAGSEVAFRILNGVLQYAPIGVFAIGASTIGGQGLDALASLAKLTGVVYMAVAVQLIVVYMLLLRVFKVPIIPFFKNVSEAISTAFMTSSSLGTLPITIKSAKKAGIGDDVSSFTLPVGATVNMDGAAIRLGVSVIFAANIIGLDLSFSALLGIVLTGTLASIGTAGVPGAGLIALSIVLTQAGLPIEVVALVAGVDVVLGMIATACNVTGDLVGAAIVDKSEKKNVSGVQRYTQEEAM